MSIAGVVRQVVFRLVRLISALCSGVVGLVRGRQSQRIGELPLFVRGQSVDSEQREPFLMHTDSNSPVQQSPFLQSTQPADSWNTWAEQEQQRTVESKIAEYRNQVEQQQRLQKQQQKRTQVRGGPSAQSAAQHSAAAPSEAEDLFSDLKPTLKATKMYRVRDPQAEALAQAPRQSLFQVREDPFANRQFNSQLGDLDAAEAEGQWDADEEVPDLDAALNEQRKQELAEKQRQRREEHERRMLQKRGMKSS